MVTGGVLVVGAPVLVEDDAGAVPLFLYTERRFPAPHFSAELPAHGKLQSARGATADPAEKAFPQ